MRLPRQLTLFLVATQFLTRLPVPRLPGFEPQWLNRSARYFPLVGVLVGGINAGTWWLCRHGFPAGVSIGLMMAVSLLVTGAFHEDGFADVCDGFGGGTSAARVLAIMKDSRVGAFGAMGITMMLGLKWTVLAVLPETAMVPVIVVSQMVSRWCATGLIWRLRYVRVEEDGKAKPLADSLGGAEWVLSGAIGTVALLPLLLVGSPLPGDARGLALVAATVAAALTAGLAGGYFRHRIGGYTGDCLGATQQIAELVFLLTMLEILSP